MFGFGPGELLVIAVLVVVLWDPRKLPSLFKDVARALQQVKQVGTSLGKELTGDRDLDLVRKELRSAASAVTGDDGAYTDLPPGLSEELMVCRPEEEWAAAIAAADAEPAPDAEPASPAKS